MKVFLVAIVLLAAGGYLVVRWEGSGAPTTTVTQPTRRTTATVEPRSIRFSITAAGDIGPAEQVSVRAEINGRIATLPVDIGDQVKRNQVLFTLDDKDLQTERSLRLIEIERCKLQLDKAATAFERGKRLFEEKIIDRQLYEDTKTDFELAKNALERAQKDLSILDDRLTKTQIVAPFACTVLTRPLSVGQAVSGAGGYNSGTEVLTIADLDNMVINAHVNQSDVTRLSMGQEVDVQVESVPGLRLKGQVDRIAPQTTIRNNVKGYAARIRLIGNDPRVLPGMTANVSIPVASAEAALAVPLGAIFTEQGERFAYVKNGEKFEKRPVQIGVYDYDYAEVLTGLTAGETVALELPPGQSTSLMVTGAKAAESAGGAGGKPTIGSGPQSGANGGAAKPGGAREQEKRPGPGRS